MTLYRFSTLSRYFERVKRRKRYRLGVDGMRVEHLNERHLYTLNSRLKSNTYTLTQPRMVKKRKTNGGYRMIGVPTLVDQIFLSTANEAIQAAIEPLLPDCVHGFRPNHSIHTAWSQVLPLVDNASYVATLDIIGAYDNVILDVLRYLAYQRIGDISVLKAIDTVTDYTAPGKIMSMSDLDIIVKQYTRIGLVQGYSTSPTLFNLYLIEVNEIMQACAGEYDAYSIYADNALMSSASYSDLVQRIDLFTRMLEGMNMRVRYDITKMLPHSEFVWLGRRYSHQ